MQIHVDNVTYIPHGIIGGDHVNIITTITLLRPCLWFYKTPICTWVYFTWYIKGYGQTTCTYIYAIAVGVHLHIIINWFSSRVNFSVQVITILPSPITASKCLEIQLIYSQSTSFSSSHFPGYFVLHIYFMARGVRWITFS